MNAAWLHRPLKGSGGAPRPSREIIETPPPQIPASGAAWPGTGPSPTGLPHA